jgi:hypothetical protein
MIKIKYTKQSFEEVLQQAYDELQSEDIYKLLVEVRSYYSTEEHKNEWIEDIANMVGNKRSLSFKQWKALSAYAAGVRKKYNNKTF